jgi:hypothetical protein
LNAARIAHIGGAIVTDRGPITLAEARSLEAFYSAEAAFCAGRETSRALCAERAAAFAAVTDAAVRWRRAAGWIAPEDADELRR